MNEPKGKGRAFSDDHDQATETSSNTNTIQPSQDPSLLSRIATSAETLARSALLAPPNSSEVVSALSVSEKNQSSGATSGHAPVEASSTPSASSSSRQQVAESREGFRDGHNEEHARQSEAEFSDFLDGIDCFSPSDDSELPVIAEIGSSTTSNIKAPVDFEGAWSRSSNLHPTNADVRTVAEQESRDGEDVLALLSNSTAFDYEQFELPLEEDENYDWGLSSEQLSEIRAMSQELFPPFVPHGALSRHNPLNLIPHNDVAPGVQLVASSSTIDPEHWSEEWEGVLTRYTDEVWGGLLPLVKIARQEYEVMKEKELEQIQPKALRRLEAILAHLNRR